MYTDISQASKKSTNEILTFDTLKSLQENKNLTGSDYALYSLLILQEKAIRGFKNKQFMKSVVLNIGFAVMSIGVMLLIFGIEKRGANTQISSGDIRLI